MEYEVFYPSLVWSLPWRFLIAGTDVRLVVCKTRAHLKLIEKHIQVSKDC